MVKGVETPATSCMYCGAHCSSQGEGEHIVQQALGGRCCIKCVCQPCNNDLSKIDTQLTGKSPLAMVKAVNSHGGAYGGWSVDAEEGVLIESALSPETNEQVPWPQVLLGKRRIAFYARTDEIADIGLPAFAQQFCRLAREAANTRRLRNRRCHWRWETHQFVPDAAGFPPRIYTCHRFADITEKSTFICSHARGQDRSEILQRLESLDLSAPPDVMKNFTSATNAESALRFSPHDVRRALVKIGVNVLADQLTSLRVDRDTFGEALAFVRDGNSPSGLVLNPGLASGAELATFECPPRTHFLRLCHDDAMWTLECVFYGGQLGALVDFPGPSDPDWRRIDVLVPIGSKKWEYTKGSLYLPPVLKPAADIGDALSASTIRPLNQKARLSIESRPGQSQAAM